ncbi:hypothetical protein E8E13_003021 [Curvularia kusanoi]|uniref:Uncharacterized protein n=1 Tax=Curvularia kusanoi TaxID=90978 RepID=A0A9P4TE56_CURKU|nr:hypothetical protein E8E13_003021 [Curvularia kusanoi]
MENDTFPDIAASNLASNLSQSDFTVIAQNIMCAYPISDIYAPTPRFLYYSLLFLTFATLRFRWLSNIFLTGAVAYAASAAIHAFIIVSNPSQVPQVGNVNLPFIPSTSNLTNSVESLVTGVPEVYVEPDAVELDIDPITAIVVTAYLVGLPLQIWSRTMRSSVIIRYMILLWNLCMLAGTICALIAWPTTNLAAPQFRFCYAGYLDLDSETSDGWTPSLWKGTWNATVWNIFNNPDTVWQQTSNNCFTPCFNTSQAIRQSSSLKAVVTTPSTRFAKLHNVQHDTNDEFQPLIYVAIIVFSAAQFFLYVVSAFRLGSEAMRIPIHEPHHLWRHRGKIWEQLKSDMARSWTTIRASLRLPKRIGSRRDQDAAATAMRSERRISHRQNLIASLRLFIDILALLTLLAGIIISPFLVVAFICWIEWYIRNDGSTNETINQVGQWAPLVSIAVVLFAALVYEVLKGRLASASELRDEIWRTELQLRKLKGQLEEKTSS